MEIIDEAKNIVLIGPMGSGKSSVGRTIARKLGRRFIDTDRYIERKAGKTISEIFEIDGEAAFRQIEKEVVKKISQYIGLVIATGGGTMKDSETFKYLKESGWTIALFASPEIQYQRVEGKRIRPLLLGKEDPVGTLEEINNERKKAYSQADFQINTDNKQIDQIADEVIEFLSINKKISQFEAGR